MVVGPRKREGSERAEDASAGLWRAENAADGKNPLARREKPAVRAYSGRPGASWGCGDPLCSLHARPMVGRCPAPRSTSPHARRCRLSLPSAACPAGGWRFRFLPLFVTYLELNRHGISRKRENAEHKRISKNNQSIRHSIHLSLFDGK